MNKVKFNRFEKYIPKTTENGVLCVSSDEQSMTFKDMATMNVTYGRNNLTNGFKATLKNNVFTFEEGQLLAHVKRAYKLNVENNKATLILNEPIWGVSSLYQFEPNTLVIEDINEKYYDTSNGADNSTMVYNQPSMTSDTTPYGIAFTNSYNENTNWSPWKAFNRITEGDNGFASADYANAPFPVTLNYSISNRGDKWIQPKSFFLQNRNSTGDAIAAPQIFQIQGSKVLHPYDDLDWVTLVNVDNVNLVHPSGQNASATYTTDTEEYFRHFRLNIHTKSTSANYVFVQQFNINGIISDNIEILNPKHNYFLIKAKKNEEIFDMFISSKVSIPVLDESIEILDFCPISSYKNINDFNNAKFYDKKNTDSIDVTSYLQPNQRYSIWVSINGTHTYIVTQNDEIPEGQYCKKIINFVTNDNNEIINYYPKNAINEGFNDRFIVQEQLGTIGYRIYNDGFKVQWGNLENPIFPIAFNQVPLVVENGATDVTKTGMTIPAGYWIVKGY